MGNTLQLEAVAQPAPIAQYDSIEWKTSSAKIATVDKESGLVTPAAEGVATITCTITRGAAKKTATVKVQVTDPYKPTGVKLYTESGDPATGTLNLAMESTLTLKEVVEPETALYDAQWKTSSDKIAAVDAATGLVTPVGEGTATITCTITRGAVKKTATVKVKVTDPYKPVKVLLGNAATETVNLYENEAPLYVDAYVADPEAEHVDEWQFKSSSEKIVKVDPETRLVTPVAEGTATITVTAVRGKVKKTASFKVKVVDERKLTALTLSKAETLYWGEALNLREMIEVAPVTAEDYTDITWKSSNEKIARVDAVTGVVTPNADKKEGTVTITATAVYQNNTKIKKTATCKVTVADPNKPQSLTLNCEAAPTLYFGETLDIDEILAPASAVEFTDIAWKSSSAKIASVDPLTGLVTPNADGKEGTVTITCTATYRENTKVKKTATVKVKIANPLKPTALHIVDQAEDGTDLTGTVEMPLLVLKDGIRAYTRVEPASADEGADYTWKSSNTVIATVDNEGLVTGIKDGTVTITCTVQNAGTKKSASFKIKIVDTEKPTSVALNYTGTYTMKMDDAPLQLIATALPEAAEASETKIVSFKSSAASIAAVDPVTGVVTPGTKAGTATITCTVENHGVKKTATVKIKVVKS